MALITLRAECYFPDNLRLPVNGKAFAYCSFAFDSRISLAATYDNRSMVV